MNTTSRVADHDTSSLETRPRRWRRRTKVLVAAGSLVAVAGSVVALDCALRDRDSQTRHFDQPINSVSVDISAGSIRLVGTNESTITVESSSRGGIRGPNHHERVENGRLVITSSCPLHLLTPSCEIDYTVHVPSHVSVEMDGNGLDARIESITGDLDVAINGGDVDAAFSAAPRNVKMRANGGSIDVVIPNDQSTYRTESSSNGGSSTVDVRTDPASDRSIDVHTNGGRITVRYP
jgi:hypothetical protein